MLWEKRQEKPLRRSCNQKLINQGFEGKSARTENIARDCEGKRGIIKEVAGKVALKERIKRSLKVWIKDQKDVVVPHISLWKVLKANLE